MLDPFSDLVPSGREYQPATGGSPYPYTTSPDAVMVYNPATGISTFNPNAGALANSTALNDGTDAALATQLGGGPTVVPTTARVGDHPTTGQYGANFQKAMYVWLRGGDPSSLAARPAPVPAGATGATAPPATTGTGSAPASVPVGTTTGAPAGTPASAAPTSALSGWNQFYNSPTYQVPLEAGLKAVNTKYAAMGALESGAAMKAISDYAAGNASSALSTYLDDLYRQEALGAQSAGALATGGQNLFNQVSTNNTNAANATGNAQLVAGQASANNWNNAGNAIGTAAGSIAGAMGSSYAPSNALAPAYYTPTVSGIPVPV